jgi:hypothetical protein
VTGSGGDDVMGILAGIDQPERRIVREFFEE